LDLKAEGSKSKALYEGELQTTKSPGKNYLKIKSGKFKTL